MVNTECPNIPQPEVTPDEWADACGRMCSIDGFEITGKSILVAVRKPSDIPECGEFAQSVARACNHLAAFSAGHPRKVGRDELLRLCSDVNEKIVAGAVESKMLNGGREGRRFTKDSPPDPPSRFSARTAWEMLEAHSWRFSLLASELCSTSGTGLLPIDTAHRAGGFCYTFPLDMATVCPFGALNGMTGRMVGEALRLRLRLPFYGFQMTRNTWLNELGKQQERGQHFSDLSTIPVAQLYGNVV